MIPDQLARRSDELAHEGEPFVTATVVRVQHPTSVTPGSAALVRADGTIEGFVGGVCAQHSVRLYSLEAIERGEPLLLRIMPDPDELDPDAAPIDAGQELSREDGAVTVRNPCLSGGAIEVFLEPTLPAPRLLAAGESPIVTALMRLGPEVGFEVLVSDGRRDQLTPAAGDFALVVAAHGRDELSVLRAGLELGLPYVGLVASARRGKSVLDELRGEGVSAEQLDTIDTPAGLDIGAHEPAEVALAILARIIEIRRAGGVALAARAGSSAALGAGARKGPLTAVDPICGMTVVVGADTPSAQRDGETTYFCCDGCRRSFEQQQAA
ncbi:MAG: XdhC family protein [Solirubrobacteraceae bacterium]